jgi:amino acid adenylation domain-containing protein
MQTKGLKGAHLSAQQLRLWRWGREKPWSRVQCALEITGALELDILRLALKQVISRYEILYTTFPHMPGMEQPMQVVGEPCNIPCPLVDLEQLNPQAQQVSQEEHWHDFLQYHFDLEKGPLLQVELLRLSARRHILMLRLSTFCADGATLNILSIELFQAYCAYLYAEEGEAEQPLQYANVADWLDELLQEEEAAEQFAYWHKYDLSQVDSTPLPFARRKEQASSGREINAVPVELRQLDVDLPAEVYQHLRGMSQRLEVSAEVILLASWQTLLWRLTGKQNICSGMLCDGRPYEELTDLVGPLARMLPISTTITEHSTFAVIVRQMQQVYEQATEKQLYFNWEPDSSDQVIANYFPLSFAYESWPEFGIYGPLKVLRLRQESWGEPFQLQLRARQSETNLRLQMIYDPSVLSEQGVQRLAHIFVQWLKAATNQPESALETLALLTWEEQYEQDTRWRGEQHVEAFVPLHQLVEEQAWLHPHLPAVRSGETVLSYQQLDQQSTQLAHLLLKRGLLHGQRVALLLPRDPWALVALLGVLKAGGCYAPLDEDLPDTRLQLLVERLTPALLLTTQAQIQRLAPLAVPSLLLEELPALLDGQPTSAPGVAVGPEDLAYVLWTSGSTGTPKGVLIRQQSVSNYTLALRDLLGVQPGWGLATVSSLAADLGNTSIFCGLASGGCVHLLPAALVSDGAAFARYAQQWPLDVLKIVPSHLRALLAVGASQVVPRQRLVLGGEALPWSLVEQVQRLGGNPRLYNHYGPTEATIGILVNDLGPVQQVPIPQEQRRGSSVPLGRPLVNTRVSVRDGQGQVVPVGVSGELWLAGVGLAAGYLGAREQEQGRFVQEEGRQECWYRSGDQVRENEQGELEYEGRQDNQVKLRGYRIELGEIEEHLRRHPEIREAAVLKRERRPEEEELVGYIVPWKQPGPEQEEVRKSLAETLPSYLIPGRIVKLRQLPLTANGKLDRQRLSALESEEEEKTPGAKIREARTPIEEVMVGIWQEVLGVGAIDREERFFRLGGHSLLGTRVIARLRTIFGIEVPILWLFETPTVAGLSRRIEEELSLGRRGEIIPIARVRREEAFPLSFAQQRLWFLDQLEPGSTAYSIPRAMWVRGPLHYVALEHALRDVIRRHESLRTTFPSQEGEPVQCIAAESKNPLFFVDLSGLVSEQRELVAQRLAQQEAEQPFDLARGPLLRAQLLLLSAQEHVLLLTMHHIVSDGWSSSILVRELSSLYNGFVSGDPVSLSVLPIQYADYALWQRQWLQGEVLQKQLDYWQKQLAGLSPLELLTDRPRQALQSSRGALLSVVLPRKLNEELKQLSQKNGCTLFMVLLAAFQVLLARYSGQEDIVVGTPVANRTREEIEGLIGFFVNTLVLRSDLLGDPSFAELLTRVRRMALEAYAHQDVPFEQVVEVVQPGRDLNRSPLFQVLFALQNNLEVQAEQSSVQTEDFAIEQYDTKFELSMVVTETSQGLDTTLEYSTDLFDEATMARLLIHWRQLLEGIVANVQQSLSSLPLLSLQERDQILLRWNETSAPLPESSLHVLFEQQVKHRADAIAVISEEEFLTYAELNRRANLLAHQLLQSGVTPGSPVAISLERSINMVVGLLAILKAGGAYVPLDSDYPPERLALMLQDTQASVLISQQSLLDTFPVSPQVVICLDTSWESIAHGCDQNPDLPVTNDFPAYIIYTSGSVGKPKGVCVSHQAIKRLICNTDYLQIASDDHVAQASNSSFDAATFEIWGALTQGACLTIIPKEITLSPHRFAAQIREWQISVLFLTTALFNLMAREVPSAFSTVSHVLFGGEAVDPRWVREVLRKGPPKRLLHVYGPTETTTFATWYRVESVTEEAITIPIGRPIANTSAYILDSHLNPVSVGMHGELYLGGVGLASGYFGMPEQTAEKYIPDPFSAQSGARLYKTGDLVRWQSSGDIEFLGRIDHQVKMRGYRIEPGEIEVTLARHRAIREVVVVVREDVPGDKRLVAYLTSVGKDVVPGNAELRRLVQQSLPAYMVPSAFIFLLELPLTPNGKVDRRKLPAPVYSEEALAEKEERGLIDPIEELVQQVWQEVLQRKVVRIQENFFEIGGHSLLATQVVARIRTLLGMELALRTLFEAPTIAELAARLRQELRQGIDEEVLPIGGFPRPEQIPLSYAQQRLWFLDQLEPGNSVYTIPMASHLLGPLCLRDLQYSLQALVERHESLRTTFSSSGDTPIQRIWPYLEMTLPLIDLSGLLPEQREALVTPLLRQEAARPFDLQRGPLLRLHLLRLGLQEHLLLLNMHHIISDGWSMSLLVSELTTLYTTTQRKQAPQLPALPLQYADYALWQRQWLQGEVLQQQLAYWRGALAGQALLELPTDFPRPSRQSFRGARLFAQVSDEVAQALRALSLREGSTLFMTLLASFQVLLARYSGQSDISVGSPIANRRYTELQDVIGFFANTLVLRTNLAGEPGFVEVLRRVCEVCLGAYAHQDVPFEQVVEALEPVRDLSRSPLFQVFFALQNAPHELAELADMQMRNLDMERTVSKFDLTLTISETGQGLSCSLEYNTDLFEYETIERMLGHWQTLLAGIVREPQQSIWLLPLLTPPERAQLNDWKRIYADFPRELCLPQLFEQQVQRTPEAIALVFEEQQLSYAVLNRRANQLAHRLQTLGIGPERLVGICMQRSLDLVIALLGVLKAGGAYVPLDPTYPQERLSWMVQDARLSLVITHQPTVEVLQAEGAATLDLQRDWGTIASQPHENAQTTLCAGNLIYAIYTSGSTGRPKGVMNTHRGVVNYLRWRQETYHLEPWDRVVQKTPFSFDVSVWELFLPVITGSCLIMARPGGHQDPTYLRELVSEQQVTMMHFVPAMLHAFLQESNLWACYSLRKVMCSGEALSLDLQDRFFARFPREVELHNLYGPTEASVEVTFWACRREEAALTVPIGMPIANTQLAVLDQHLQPVPIGIPGELYLGGICLARGYVQRADLTAERFVPHPWGQEPGERLYKTGDLVRYRPDGAVEYLGRLDQQVKIRGNRIELGEIEAVLEEQECVHAVVVQAREDGPGGEKRLMAYVVRQPGASLTGQELRASLRDRLPSYMLPAAVMFLEAMPLLSNGKIDRRALPSPEELTVEEDAALLEVRTPVEELVAALWSQVLGGKLAGRQSNFFEMGGHSLLATQVIGRVRQTFVIDLPLRALFEAPTLAAFAQRIEHARGEGEALEMPPLLAVMRPDVLPLSFAQQRLWFLYQMDPHSAFYNMPGAFRLKGPLSVDALQRSWHEIIQRHEVLRTTFGITEGEAVQQIVPQWQEDEIFLLIDLSQWLEREREERVQSWIRQEAQQVFDLARGPLVRMRVLKIEDESYIALVTMHHIVSDGWSIGLFLKELTSLYNAFVRGEPSPLPSLPVQYADFAVWQRTWLQGETLERELAYWRRQLVGMPEVIDLPLDHDRPAVQSYHGAQQSVPFSEGLAQSLRELSQQEGVTSFMALLTTFLVLLWRYSGQEDIVVGTPIANRGQVELEGLIGFFANTLVLRTSLDGDPTFRTVLERVREVTLGAYSHQDIPFEKLVEVLRPERSMSYAPLVQAVFALLPPSIVNAHYEFTGLTMDIEATDSETSKFDLIGSIIDDGQVLQGQFSYNQDLFEAETIQRLLSYWQVVVEQMVADLDQQIDNFPLLTKDEIEQFLSQGKGAENGDE